jgi:hypothetical protein
MVNWRVAQQRAAKTGKWAVTMTKVRIRKTIARTRWQLITFVGPRGGESVGIIDLMAIRKNHSPGRTGLKRGDLFEIVLIQVKGGAAPFPSSDDVKRLRLVGAVYSPKAILLAQWIKGTQANFYCLDIASADPTMAVWKPLNSLAEVFR